jgi:hypothetical protein
MPLTLNNHVVIARPDTGGTAFKEWYPHSLVLKALLNTGVIRGEHGAVAPVDLTKLWFDTATTTHGADGTLKRHNGTTWVATPNLLDSRIPLTSADIVDDFTTGGANKVASAERVKVLNTLITTGVGTSATYANIAARNAATNINDGDSAYVIDDGDTKWAYYFRSAGAWVKLLDQDDLSASVANALQKDGSVTPTANLPMGSFKLTGLAAGSANGDSVRFEQLPIAASVTPQALGVAAVGTGTTFARDNHVHAMPRLDQTLTPTANVAMGGMKFTGLAAGSANGDSVRFEQLLVTGFTRELI